MARHPKSIEGSSASAGATQTPVPVRALTLFVFVGTLTLPPAPTFARNTMPTSDREPPREPSSDPRPQATDPLNTDPELNDPSVDRQLDAMRKRNDSTKAITPRRRANEPAVQPPAGQSADPVPGMAAADFGVPGARRLREGAFISRRPGALVQIPSGDWVFVPRPLAGSNDQDSGKARTESLMDRPLILLPSLTLERLEAAMSTAEAGHERPAAVISGQIFSYRDREYILPQQPSSLVTATAEQTVTRSDLPPSGKHDEVPRERPKESDQASVQELIRDLEARRTNPRALSPSGTASSATGPRADNRAGPVPEINPNVQRQAREGDHARQRAQPDAGANPSSRSGEHAKTVLPEGTILTSRRGRVVRLAAGELAFAVDGDGQNGIEPPMTLLPSATLQRLEDLILWRGERQTVEISGRLTSYAGKNYLMPTIFVVPPGSELGPMQ